MASEHTGTGASAGAGAGYDGFRTLQLLRLVARLPRFRLGAGTGSGGGR